MFLVRLRTELVEVIHYDEDLILFVDLGPSEERGVRVIPALGKPYIHQLRNLDESESRAHCLQLIQVVRPVIHEPAPPLEQVRAPVRRLDPVLGRGRRLQNARVHDRPRAQPQALPPQVRTGLLEQRLSPDRAPPADGGFRIVV